MCSAEQPALKALCVCLSQSACQTMLIPSEAWLTSSHAFFSSSPSPPISIGLCCPPPASGYVVPPVSQPLVHIHVGQSHRKLPIDLAGSDSNHRFSHSLFRTACDQLPMVLCSRSMSNSWPTRRENKEEQCVCNHWE